MDDGWIALFVCLPSREGTQNIEIAKKEYLLASLRGEGNKQKIKENNGCNDSNIQT